MQLEQEIKSSNTSEEVRKETNKLINQSNEIMQRIRVRYGIDSNEYRNAWKEYEDIRNGIINALKEDKKITEVELNLIKLEFSQLSNLTNLGNRSALDKLSSTAKKMGASTSLLSAVGIDTSNLNAYQEEIVENILGNKSGFGNGYLHGFSKEKGGNYVIKIDDFEKQISQNNIKDINSLSLANYFSYLESKGELNIDTLLSKMGNNNIYNLKDIWLNPKDGYSQLAKQKLEKMKGGKDLIGIIKVFSGTDEFLSGASKLNQEQKHLALKLLDKNMNSIGEKFREDLTKKFKKANPNMKESEINKIINEMFNKLSKHKNLDGLLEIYKIFDEYNEKYKLGLSISEETKKIIEIQKNKAHSAMIRTEEELKEAEKNGDKAKADMLRKEQKKQKIQVKEIEAMSKVSGKTDDKKIKQIVLGEVNFQDYIVDIRKQDESLDKMMVSLEQEKKDYEEKYKESLDKKDKAKQNNPQETQLTKTESTFSYSDGTKLTYSQVNSGGFLVETKSGEIEINADELKIIKNNKDALDNMVKFRETLDELNLGGLFKYREGIFKAISNKNTLAFNVNDDYLNKNELTIFVQAVLHSVGYELTNVANFEALKSEVRNVNRVGLVGGVKDVNVYGDSYIEQKFIERFDPNRTSIFNQNAFEESLGKGVLSKTV